MVVTRNPSIPKRTFLKFLTSSTKETSTGGSGKSDVLDHLETQFKIDFAEKLRRFFQVSYPLYRQRHESINFRLPMVGSSASKYRRHWK